MNKQNQNELYFLDILKFFAAISIAVLLHYNDHFLPFLKQENPLKNNAILYFLSINSYIFVEMFFIISGMLFVKAYMKKIQTNLSFFNFFSNRIRRIYPLLIITSLYMYIANYILFEKTNTLWSGGTLELKELILDIIFAGKSILFMPKTLNGPIWYIGVLMLCYLLAYFITKFFKKYYIYCFLLLVIFGLFMNFHQNQYVLFNYDIARGLISFFNGSLLMIFLQKQKIFSKKFIKIILVGILIIICYYLYHKQIFLVPQYFTAIASTVIFPLLFIILYGSEFAFLKNKTIRTLGDLSYPIYLWNFPIFITLHLLITLNLLNINILSYHFLFLVAIIHIFVAYSYKRLFSI